jgi:uncharacterized membrane protein
MARKGLWALMALLAALVAAYAYTNTLAPGFRTPFVRSLFDQKMLRAFGHLLGGGTALLVGAFQFNTTLRNRRPDVHRLLGKVYLAGVLVGGLSALLLAPVSAGGLTAHLGFGLLAAGWLSTAGMAYAQALAGEYESHREWMTRSYALCLAAVTLRVYLPLAIGAGVGFETAYPIISWACWVPNLIVAEWLLRSNALTRAFA